MDFKLIQEWFGKAVRSPLEGIPFELLAQSSEYIVPSPTLEPEQRIQIYNQQYWWRLLKTLQQIYPFLTGLLGHDAFNQQIAVPYLQRYQPRHWSVDSIGEFLPDWVSDFYHADNKLLAQEAVCIDWAFHQSFKASQGASLAVDPEGVFSTRLFLQPHVHLFRFTKNLFQMREQILKQQPLENLNEKRDWCFVMFRNQRNAVACNAIELAEYQLLEEFLFGSSLETLCERLEQELVDVPLQKWIQGWIGNGLLTPENVPGRSRRVVPACAGFLESSSPTV